MTKNTSEGLWTTRELADFLGMSLEGVRMARKRGQIPKGAVVKLGSRLRFRSTVIRDWVASLSDDTNGNAK